MFFYFSGTKYPDKWFEIFFNNAYSKLVVEFPNATDPTVHTAHSILVDLLHLLFIQNTNVSPINTNRRYCMMLLKS